MVVKLDNEQFDNFLNDQLADYICSTDCMADHFRRMP